MLNNNSYNNLKRSGISERSLSQSQRQQGQKKRGTVNKNIINQNTLNKQQLYQQYQQDNVLDTDKILKEKFTFNPKNQQLNVIQNQQNIQKSIQNYQSQNSQKKHRLQMTPQQKGRNMFEDEIDDKKNNKFSTMKIQKLQPIPQSAKKNKNDQYQINNSNHIPFMQNNPWTQKRSLPPTSIRQKFNDEQTQIQKMGFNNIQRKSMSSHNENLQNIRQDKGEFLLELDSSFAREMMKKKQVLETKNKEILNKNQRKLDSHNKLESQQLLQYNEFLDKMQQEVNNQVSEDEDMGKLSQGSDNDNDFDFQNEQNKQNSYQIQNTTIEQKQVNECQDQIKKLYDQYWNQSERKKQTSNQISNKDDSTLITKSSQQMIQQQQSSEELQINNNFQLQNIVSNQDQQVKKQFQKRKLQPFQGLNLKNKKKNDIDQDSNHSDKTLENIQNKKANEIQIIDKNKSTKPFTTGKYQAPQIIIKKQEKRQKNKKELQEEVIQRGFFYKTCEQQEQDMKNQEDKIEGYNNDFEQYDQGLNQFLNNETGQAEYLEFSDSWTNFNIEQYVEYKKQNPNDEYGIQKNQSDNEQNEKNEHDKSNELSESDSDEEELVFRNGKFENDENYKQNDKISQYSTQNQSQ